MVLSVVVLKIQHYWKNRVDCLARLPIFCVNGVGVFMGLKCGRWQKNKERLLRLLSLLFLKHTGVKNITKPLEPRIYWLYKVSLSSALCYDVMWESWDWLGIIYFPNSTLSAGNQTQAQISAANLSNIETICHNVIMSQLGLCTLQGLRHSWEIIVNWERERRRVCSGLVPSPPSDGEQNRLIWLDREVWQRSACKTKWGREAWAHPEQL